MVRCTKQLAGLIAAISMTAGLAQAQCPPSDTLDPGGLSSHANYGSSTAIDSDLAAIGARSDDRDPNNQFTGAVYTWRHDGTDWQLEQRITAFDGEPSDEFGWSVAVAGDFLAVGAPGDDDLDTSAGAVYMYEFDGTDWVFDVKLTKGGQGDGFGDFVALDGKVLVVGSTFNEQRVEVYRHQGKFVGWQLEQTFTGVDNFGTSADVSGDLLIIGHVSGTDTVSFEGIAHIYEFDGAQWIHQQVLSGSAADTHDHFGRAVAIAGQFAAIGAPQDETGSVYLFELRKGTWTEKARFVPGTGTIGYRVALDGNAAVAGGEFSSTAYEFRRVDGIWFQAGVFSAASSPRLGKSVSISGKRAILGSNSIAKNSGADECPVASLRLVVDNPAPAAGDKINLSTYCGLPGNLVGYVLVHVDGTPTFQPLIMWFFGADYTLTIGSTVPAGLSGITLGLQCVAQGPGDKKDLSNIVDVAFQ